ncbi:MAG: recombination-associated protein RdgC [Deltaproteobacteria bacterium]|jgi:DNA recombination-dependent growth factor C|nr:recombination-associated protein RdgC [Deltaproteobacteria bacterium]
MGILKGAPTVTRYRVTSELPEEYTEPFIGERLKKYAFKDIENSSEEISLGWVELLDTLSFDFDDGSYRIGPNYVFTMRQDQRKLPTKILNRYYMIREAEIQEKTGRKPNSVKRKELKEALRLELLRRCLLTTDVWEVVWLTARQEIWLAGAGEKLRALFEEIWGRTFGLPLMMLVPVTIGLELLDEEGRLALQHLKPSLF